MKRLWFTLISFQMLVLILVCYAVIDYSKEELKIIACDVGQGDAILVTYRDFQILIDGGPNDKVLMCLSENIPFWDRQLEVVILSHPQKDHFSGLIDVFEIYNVKYFLTTPLDSGSLEWEVLKDLVGSGSTRVINPKAGDRYRFGLIYLDILHPSVEYISNNSVPKSESENFLNGNVLGAVTSNKDHNDFSVVLVLSFGDFDALFTGDIGPKLSDSVIKEINQMGIKSIEYIKVPHHGSKNGLTSELLDSVDPKVAVISVGINNSYGHPHKEILEMLENNNIQILRTDESGDVVVVSNGKTFWIKD